MNASMTMNSASGSALVGRTIPLKGAKTGVLAMFNPFRRASRQARDGAARRHWHLGRLKSLLSGRR